MQNSVKYVVLIIFEKYQKNSSLQTYRPTLDIDLPFITKQPPNYLNVRKIEL
ncbi:hypothetical protein BH11PSE12_BH11PSE12_11820 [soil metagenome]